MKRVAVFASCFLSLLICFPSAGLALNGWTTNVSYGSVEFGEGDTRITLNCETSSRAFALAEAISPALEVSGKTDFVTTLSFDLTLDGFSTNNAATVSVSCPDSSYSVNLLKISGTTLSVLGDSSMTVALENGAAASVAIVFNIADRAICVTINGVVAYSGVSDALSYLAPQDLCLSLQNYFTRNIIAASSLTIGGLSFTAEDAFAFLGLYAGGNRIGGACAQGALAQGLIVAFTGAAADQMYAQDNYAVFVDGDPVGFTVAKTDGGVQLVLSSGIFAPSEIRVAMDTIADCFQNDYDTPKIFTFSVVGDDYAAPSIEMSCDRSLFRLGESARLGVLVGGSHWDNIKIYVNGVCVDDYEQASFDYLFKPSNAGSYTVKAVVTDDYGGTAEAAVVLTFEGNAPPQISFADYAADSVIYMDYEDAKCLKLHVFDSDGDSVRVEVYINETLCGEMLFAPYEIDLDALGIGLGKSAVRAAAYDSGGLSAECALSVQITKSLSKTLLTESAFNESGGSYGSGISIARQRGFGRTEQVDSVHGDSLILGMDETCDAVGFSSNQYTFVQSSIDTSHSLQTYEFDVYVGAAPVKAAGVSFGIRRQDAVVASLFSVTPTSFNFSGYSAPYTIGSWSRVKLTVSLAAGNQYYTAQADGETVCSNVPIDLGDAPTHYRFYTTTDPENYCGVAVDNISVSTVLRSFVVEGVGSADNMYSGKTPKGLCELYVYTDGAVVRADLNGTNIALYKGGVRTALSAVRYNSESGLIRLSLAEPLWANAVYRLEFSGGIRFDEGRPLGAPIDYFFETAPEDVLVEKMGRKIRKNDLEISLSVSNLSDEDIAVSVFASTFDENGRFAGTRVFSETLAKNSSGAVLSYTLENSAAHTAQIFVTDGINIGKIYDTRE